MKSQFFLKNTALCPVHIKPEVRGNEFTDKVRKIIDANGMTAELYPAIWCENVNNPVKGVLVELSYIFPSALIKMAAILKEETGQGDVFVTTTSEFAPPSWITTKTTACQMTNAVIAPVEDATEILTATANNFCAVQEEFRAKHYFTPTAVIYETNDGIKLFSFARPDVDHNADYWQKMMGKFFKSIEKQVFFKEAYLEKL